MAAVRRRADGSRDEYHTRNRAADRIVHVPVSETVQLAAVEELEAALVECESINCVKDFLSACTSLEGLDIRFNCEYKYLSNMLLQYTVIETVPTISELRIGWNRERNRNRFFDDDIEIPEPTIIVNLIQLLPRLVGLKVSVGPYSISQYYRFPVDENNDDTKNPPLDRFNHFANHKL